MALRGILWGVGKRTIMRICTCAFSHVKSLISERGLKIIFAETLGLHGICSREVDRTPRQRHIAV